MANNDLTPHLMELKAFSGSEELHEAFKFLYTYERAEDEVFIQFLGERRDELQASIERRSARLADLWKLNHDEEESAGDVYDCEHKFLVKQRARLEVLTGLLFELRQGVIEKDESISILEVYD